MKRVKHWRTLSLVIWIVVTVIMVITMPDLDQLVREKGQITIPKDAKSEIAKDMMNKMNENGGGTYQIIAVYNSNSEKALTEKQREEIKSVINELQRKETELGIKKIVSHLDNVETEKQLVSEDKTTVLTQISVDKEKGTITEVVHKLNKIIQIKDVKTYLTGNDIVLEDFVKSTQDGVKKTEIIAVIFIILVLIIVFRSPIVPVVSLLTVGISYLVSLGIIANLVDRFNYPFSNFTQVFLVVILFGIGTDYNILLFTRFKEELSRQENPMVAMKETFKTAGKTILYSGLAVFIGFISLIMAQFKLYQATSAVAIGIAVLILILMTLSPFFMVLLGKKMFYPIKRFEGHGDSRLWTFLSRYSVGRPLVALFFVGILCIPLLLTYSGNLNYNPLFDVGNSYASKQGIKVIEKHFPAGFSSPATLMVEAKRKLDNQQSLQVLDELAEKISNVQGVSKVYTPTRPTGEKIKELYINDQSKTLNTGLGDANSGVGEINKGLSSAVGQLGNKGTSDLANVQTLINGTGTVKSGFSALEGGMKQVTAGMNKGAGGAAEIEKGLASINESIGSLSSATSQLYKGYTDLEKGLSSYSPYFDSIAGAVNSARNGYEQIEGSMTNLMVTHPELANDPNVQKTLGIARSGKQQLGELSKQLTQLTGQYNAAMSSFREANASLAKVNAGLSQMQNGVVQLQKGSADLKNGLNDGAQGSSQITDYTTQLSSGLNQVNNGQKQLLSGLNGFQEKMGLLQTGLVKSTKGLDEVSKGLNDAQDYLNGMGQSPASEKFYVPQEVLEGADFQKGLNMYMSDNRQSAQMMIILDVNPYSQEAMPIIKKINDQVDAALKSSNLSDARVAVGGKSAENVDLQDISSSDFLRTAIIMLIGIGLVLFFITRSILQPIFIIGSLLLAYFTSLGISEIISTHLLGEDLLSWNAPFFSFIMIVALGVDYSIFFMMRYKELEDHSFVAIVKAAGNIGGVIISAAIILGGTFAALIPSGIQTLIQVAMVVVIGLLLLSLVMLPIFIPALMGFTHKLSRFTMKSKANGELPSQM